jgi:hypothetical protein
MFKVLTPILLKLPPPKKEEILPNLFYEASIAQTPMSSKDTIPQENKTRHKYLL